ncbi:hypothetical protein MRX96_024284 [Rhipicephalus microplus]
MAKEPSPSVVKGRRRSPRSPQAGRQQSSTGSGGRERKDFGGSNFEVTFRNKVAVDRFLADSATIKVKETDIRFEYRGLRTVSVCVYEYPAEASDKVLSRALEVYGKVQNMSDDNLTGLHITTGNRRARMGASFSRAQYH